MKRNVVATIVLLTLLTPALTASPDPAPGVRRGLHDRAELESFLDGLMLANMSDQHIVGATVSVVKDGTLFLAKGYGYADFDRRTLVDPERTLFRIGSVSKLFTWTAVMQLVEAGKLDLDVDVNRYLEFKIPDTYPQPITLRHMMTHTTGFEEDVRDMLASTPEQTGLIGPWLATHMPGRVRPPGVYAAYSNYASALAAHVVERVSGLTWQEYEERFIFRPLGMCHTTARQALPEALRTNMSTGYRYVDGRVAAEPFELFTGLAPAGAIAASAVDMATFMVAHLNGGAANGGRVLSATATEQMHRRTFAHDARLPGFALGFYEQSSHQLRIVGHGGNTQWFHTDLTLIPSEGIGLFVSYNTDTGHTLSIGPFLREFLDHYYPAQPAPASFDPEARARARRIAGEYRLNRMSYTTFQRATGLANPTTVSANADGTLQMSSPFGWMHLLPVEPWLYRDGQSGDLVLFKADSSGKTIGGFIGPMPMTALERVPWRESARLHRVIIGFAAAVFILTIWGAIGRAVRRAFRHARAEDALRGRAFVTGAAAADLTFLIVLAFMVSSDATAIATTHSLVLRVALTLPVVAAVLASAAVVVSIRQWLRQSGRPVSRIRYAGVVAVTLLFTWSLNQWNLIGWRF